MPTPDGIEESNGGGRPPALGARLRGFFAGRVRTLGIMVPIHLFAFLVLYVGTVVLVRSTFVQAGSEVPRQLVERSLDQLGDVARTRQLLPGRKHFWELVIAAHRSIDLRLFDPQGQPLGPSPPGLPAELLTFLQNDAPERFWLTEEEGAYQLRGFKRIRADPRCIDCHEAGEALAVASVAMDISDQMVGLNRRMKWNVALMIAAWAVLLAVVSITAKKAVARSARRLEADLEAAVSGKSGASRGPAELALDPVSARLHRSLRQFLESRREREEELADRLVHHDQLASLGKLAAGLAHEIKNPLAGIQGAVEILREDSKDGEASELYGEILSELQRVHEILQLLLTTARPSPPRLIATDVRSLAEDVRRLLAPGLRKRSVTLELELGEGDLTASLDPGKIRQVLINLLNNAAEAMHDGGRVVLRASLLPAGDGLIVAVEDDGPGISLADRERIFEPFFSTKYSGTGLGLAISRTLVEQHGGTLEVESTPGEGSTFLILLPSPIGAEPGRPTEAPDEA